MEDILGNDDGPVELRVNRQFAEKFERVKRKQELSSLKEREKRGELEVSSSDSESEDEDGDLLTADVDAEISATLALIQKKDPRIYDSKVAFFKESSDNVQDDNIVKQKVDKPIYYKDLVREQVLAGDVEANSDSEEEEPIKTYAQEQNELKGEFLSSVAGASTMDGDEDDLFAIKPREENDGVENLQNLDDESFLQQYLSKGGWKDVEPKTADAFHEEVRGRLANDDEEAEDAEAVDAADAFESKYNFRFEEEGGDRIETYARDVHHSMRRKDETRKVKRQQKVERKALERKKKEEELRHLKNLKRQELQEKVVKIYRMAGKDDVDECTAAELAALMDIEGDFDPEEHDRKMATLFTEEYYEEEDPKKAIFSEKDELVVETVTDIEEEIEHVPANTIEVEEDEEEEEAGSELAEVQQVKKKYEEELYALDYEDMIGDMPCRFKYRSVESNDFGLDAETILAADDEDLKSYVSLKRLAPYRESEFVVPRKRAKQFKKQVDKSIAEAAQSKKKKKAAEKEKSDEQNKKYAERQQKKSEKKAAAEEAAKQEPAVETPVELTSGADVDEAKTPASSDAVGKKKRKRKKKSKEVKTDDVISKLNSSRLDSYRLKQL